ncbi:MAG: hypothetical protein ACI9GM_000263 [Salibacteraceae bacterium]|jgi:hypothetical protein
MMRRVLLMCAFFVVVAVGLRAQVIGDSSIDMAYVGFLQGDSIIVLVVENKSDRYIVFNDGPLYFRSPDIKTDSVRLVSCFTCLNYWEVTDQVIYNKLKVLRPGESCAILFSDRRKSTEEIVRGDVYTVGFEYFDLSSSEVGEFQPFWLGDSYLNLLAYLSTQIEKEKVRFKFIREQIGVSVLPSSLPNDK